MAGRHMQFLGLFHHSVIWNKWLVYNRAPMVWLATRQPPLPPHPPWFCCQHPAGRPWLGAARSHTRPIWGSTGPSYTGCLPPTCQLELLLQPLLPVLLGEWLMHISPNYWDASRQVRQTSRLIPSVHIGLVLPKLGQWGLTGSTLLQEVPQKDGSKLPRGRRSWSCQEIISLIMARRRPLSLHHLVSRFPAEAAPMSTDLLRWLRYFSEDMLPFNQKLSTILVVKLHFSAVADFFIFCQHFLLLFFNILVLM